MLEVGFQVKMTSSVLFIKKKYSKILLEGIYSDIQNPNVLQLVF